MCFQFQFSNGDTFRAWSQLSVEDRCQQKGVEILVHT